MLEREDLLELRLTFLNSYPMMPIVEVKTEITAAELWDYNKKITPEIEEDFDYLKPDERFILQSKYVYLYMKSYLVSSIYIQGVVLAVHHTDSNITFTLNDGSSCIECVFCTKTQKKKIEAENNPIEYGNTLNIRGLISLKFKLLQIIVDSYKKPSLKEEIEFCLDLEREMVKREKKIARHAFLDEEGLSEAESEENISNEEVECSDLESNSGINDEQEILDMQLLDEIMGDEETKEFTSEEILLFQHIQSKTNVKSLIMLNFTKSGYFPLAKLGKKFVVSLSALLLNKKLIQLCVKEFGYDQEDAVEVLNEIIVELEQIGFLQPSMGEEDSSYQIDLDLFNKVANTIFQGFKQEEEREYDEIASEINDWCPDTFSKIYIDQALDELTIEGSIQKIAEDVYRKA